MGWHFGIPDFSIANHFTYFNDLQDTTFNSEIGAIRKIALWNQAVNNGKMAINFLNDVRNIKLAQEFLLKIADSEREKELNVVRAYYKKIGETLPQILQEYKNPEDILNSPEEFYAQLTASINEARKGTSQYLTELKRIQTNILNKAERTLETYKQDDYRYRLVGDITSFLHRLNGGFGLGGKQYDEEDGDAFSIKLQKIVMRILEAQKIPQKLSSGLDFSAIAAATLVDIEKEVQQKVDEQLLKPKTSRDLSKITDEALKEIESKYLQKLKSQGEDQSPVQRALNDITGIDFLRITQNAKELLNLKSDASISELTRRSNNISRLSLSRSRASKEARASIREIRHSLRKNKNLANNLISMNFSISGSAETKHGTVYEFIESMLGSNIKGNTATDIITYDFGYQLESNDAFFDAIIQNISSTIAQISEPEVLSEANNRDIRKDIRGINQQIDFFIKKAEEDLKELGRDNEFNNIFIYHETLKLYSSVETGRSKDKSFHGRTMNILSFIDYMDSASVANFSLAIDRELMSFIALNLMNNTAAPEAKDPLQTYFSIFAGLLMFDDVQNMALEAAKKIQPSKIQQIHLYNLNGIYVPSSMLLSYVSDAIETSLNFILGNNAAKATITVPDSNATYIQWQQGELQKDSNGDYIDGALRPEHWQAVGADTASHTKVTIVFFAAFQKFIEKLNSL